VSERFCLIERDERGDRIRAVRLVGQHADAAWSSPRHDGRYVSDAADDADAAADWIAERLGVEGDSLGLLVLDTSGSRCAWVHAASAEVGAVRGAYTRGGDTVEDDFDIDMDLDDEPVETSGLGSRPTPMEASIEPLGAAYEAEGGLRVGVLVAPDAIVRLLIDGLNKRGIEFAGVTTLWHVIAWAAEPVESQIVSSRVVADSPTVSCGVLLQPDGHLVWSWCRDGVVLAAGTQRLSIHDDGPIVTSSDVARLVNDWVAWSAQVGVSPGRIMLTACPLAGPSAVGPDVEALSAPQMASRLADLWPEAVLDIDAPEDPLLEVLRTAHESRRDNLEPGQAMVALATRPGRSMRRVYQFVGLALAAAGLALAAVGIRWQGQVDAVRDDAAEIRQAYTADITEVEEMLGKPGAIVNDMVPMIALIREVDQATRSSEITRDPPRPIIEELESLSFLLGELGDRVELEEITATGVGGFSIIMMTGDAAVAGDINALLDDLAMNDGALRWSAVSESRGSRYRVRMNGLWDRRGEQP